MIRKRFSFPTRLLTRSASTVQISTSWSSPKARSHGQGAMNDLSRDVPARPVRNHVLQTSSASNAPHQCGHVDMSEPLGRARIEEQHPPNHLHGLRSVEPPDVPAKLRPVARVKPYIDYPCHKLKLRILRSLPTFKKLAAARQKAMTTTDTWLKIRSAAQHQMPAFELSPRRISRLTAKSIALLNSNQQRAASCGPA